MLLDYETLRLIWWLLLGVLLIGFAVTDGFDLGTAMLLPFVGRTDSERRVAINTIGPVWEGNQVWLILGAGSENSATLRNQRDLGRVRRADSQLAKANSALK